MLNTILSKNTFLLALGLLIVSICTAQINYKGQPDSWSLPSDTQLEIPIIEMESIDIENLRNEDEENDFNKQGAYRFGFDHDVNINFFNEARQLTVTESELPIYQLKLSSPEALTLSLIFDSFYIPHGGALFIYSSDRSELKGAFTYNSNKASGVFPVGILRGEEVIIEYNGPTENAILNISEVTHGYRKILSYGELLKGPFGDSDPCMVNINCEEGAGWKDQKRSVVLIIEGGESHCTGAVVNNTLQDETPYVLTADHCLGNPNDWVYYFNHESVTCNGNSGPIDQSIAGGTLIANRSISDFVLIELSEEIPSNYNVYYAGWDNSDESTVTQSVAIHHPKGDVKKISFDYQAALKTTTSQNNIVWEVTDWEVGATQGGSSGCPLFDQNGRIIGQLHGGVAGCAGNQPNGYFDYFGRFGFSWDGPSATSRLKDWLDPNNSGVSILNGFAPNDSVFAVDVIPMTIIGLNQAICDTDPITPSLVLKNKGTTTITSASIVPIYNDQVQDSIEWTGSLASQEFVTIELSPISSLATSTNIIEVDVALVNGIEDENPTDNNLKTELVIPEVLELTSDLEILVSTDSRAYHNAYRIRNSVGVVLAAEGLYSSWDGSTTYNYSYEFPEDGCYTFTMHDNAGNGMCCNFGDGFFTLSDELGNELHRASNFGSAEIVTIKKTTLSTNTNNLHSSNGYKIFPNPTTGSLNILFDSAFKKLNFKILDILGNALLSGQSNDKNILELDISNFNSGTYFIHIDKDGETSTQKIVLN